MITSKIIELPGDALLFGPTKMKEDHWKWPTNPPVVAFGIKTEDGESAAIVRMFLRRFECKTRSLRAVGIGGIWTRPDLRGKGYATELLAQVMKKARTQQPHADLVVMYAELRKLYTNFGFREVADGVLGVSLHGDVTILDADWSIMPEGHF